MTRELPASRSLIGMKPETARMLGAVEYRGLVGTTPLGRAMISAAMPHDAIMIEADDGSIWCWPIFRELLREQRP